MEKKNIYDALTTRCLGNMCFGDLIRTQHMDGATDYLNVKREKAPCGVQKDSRQAGHLPESALHHAQQDQFLNRNLVLYIWAGRFVFLFSFSSNFCV